MLPNHLPTPATAFIGRAEELAEIAALLADPACRLLTLLGPGGIGKTRLALQAAADQLAHYEYGVYFVPLAPVGSPDLLSAVIASALHLTIYSADDARDQLVRSLREKYFLILLDNFEHLLAATDLLTTILSAAPGVKFLVTSRERLNVEEEWALALDGLRFPDDQAAEPLESYSAVKLFVQRARQVQTNFSLDDNGEAVKVICQRVEGMPLGLELAATWLRAMSSRQIAAQIGSSLDFLTTPLRNVPERHRSLRAVFEQSWSLLSAAESVVLMRLSVFRGGFDLEAAEQVAGASLAVLAGLADKSLIRLNADARYDVHELLRQYAADKLADAGETSAAADRHLRYFLKLAEQTEAHVWGREQHSWYDRMETDLDNLRAALTWSLVNEEAETGLHLAAALGWFFTERDHVSEGLAWLERMLAANEGAPLALRAKAMEHAAAATSILGLDVQRVETYCEQTLAVARAANDPMRIAWALANLGFYVGVTNFKQTERTAAALEESLALFRKLSDPMGLNHALRRRAFIATCGEKNFLYARALLEEALIGAREADDKNGIAHTLFFQGDVAWLHDHDVQAAAKLFNSSVSLFRESQNVTLLTILLIPLAEAERSIGHYERAQAIYEEDLTLLRELAPQSGNVKANLAGLGGVAFRKGQFIRAARLFGAADSKEETYFQLKYPEVFTTPKDIAVVRAQLGEAAFAEAWAEGKAMTGEERIAYALEHEDAPSETPPIERGAGRQAPIDGLSEREVEVLRLVAAGRSNREIAADLYLALGTVKWYLNTINSKLGVTSRTQAVAEAQKLKLL